MNSAIAAIIGSYVASSEYVATTRASSTLNVALIGSAIDRLVQSDR